MEPTTGGPREHHAAGDCPWQPGACYHYHVVLSLLRTDIRRGNLAHQCWFPFHAVPFRATSHPSLLSSYEANSSSTTYSKGPGAKSAASTFPLERRKQHADTLGYEFETIDCRFCNDRYYEENSLDKHYADEHYYCWECDRSFQNRNNYNQVAPRKICFPAKDLPLTGYIAPPIANPQSSVDSVPLLRKRLHDGDRRHPPR